MMAGIEKVHFFGDRPQWLEETTINSSEKITSHDLDIDEFMASVGFYQR
jgi:hypothetical protein